MSDQTDPQEEQKRALLAAMAQQGSGAKMDPQFQVGPRQPATPQQAAVQAAYNRGAQINAPAALLNQQTGQIGAVYDQAAQSRANMAAAASRARGAYGGAASTYQQQLELARPVVEARTKIAVEKALADQADQAAYRQYQNQSLELDKRKLALEESKVSAAEKSGASLPDATPAPVDKAAKTAGLTTDQAKTVLQTDAYSKGRDAVLSALDSQYSYAELEGLLNRWATTPDPSTGQPPANAAAAAKLLLATYAPVFATQAERELEAKIAAATAEAKRTGQAVNYLTGEVVPSFK
jgi:hypothetical protein